MLAARPDLQVRLKAEARLRLDGDPRITRCGSQWLRRLGLDRTRRRLWNVSARET